VTSLVQILRRWAWTHPSLSAPFRAIWRGLPSGWTCGPGLTKPRRHRFNQVFDPAWYCAMNPDVAAAGVDPLTHYLDRGWKEGRDPHPLFDVSWYLGQHPELVPMGVEPLTHYIEWGWRESWAPHPLFDSSWYTAEYRLDGTAGLNPFIDYLTHGVAQGRFVHPDHRHAVLGTGGAVERLGRSLRKAIVAEAGTDPVVSPMLLLPWIDVNEVTIAFDSLMPLSGGLHTKRRDRIIETALTRSELAESAEVNQIKPQREPDLDVIEIVVRRHRAGKRTNIVAGNAEVQCASSAMLNVGLPSEATRIDGIRPAEPISSSSMFVGLAPDQPKAVIVTPETHPRPRGFAVLRQNLEESARAAIGTISSGDVMMVRAIEAGYTNALLPTALVAAAIEAAEVEGMSAVHYMSREGSFLARVHDVVAPTLAVQRVPPRSVHLALSRRSTFGPSLDSFTAESLMDLWRMYGNQSLRALIVSLGDDVNKYRRIARLHGLGFDENVPAIQEDQRVASFLSDTRVQSLLREKNRERRIALNAYLRETWVPQDERLLVVDVGWRGTIQDNLARAYPGSFFIGWYLALFPFLNPQPHNASKSAVGPNGNLGEAYEFMEPPAAVERPWTPDVPSVVDYRLDSELGAVPVEERELLGHTERRLIDAFQDSALRAAKIVSDWIAAEGLVTKDLRPLVRSEVTRYYREPSPGSADIWFSSAHDDTFGALNVTPFGKTMPSIRWFEDGLGHGFRQHLDQAANQSLWSPGYRRWLPVQALTHLERAFRTKSYS